MALKEEIRVPDPSQGAPPYLVARLEELRKAAEGPEAEWLTEHCLQFLTVLFAAAAARACLRLGPLPEEATRLLARPTPDQWAAFLDVARKTLADAGSRAGPLGAAVMTVFDEEHAAAPRDPQAGRERLARWLAASESFFHTWATAVDGTRLVLRNAYETCDLYPILTLDGDAPLLYAGVWPGPWAVYRNLETAWSCLRAPQDPLVDWLEAVGESPAAEPLEESIAALRERVGPRCFEATWRPLLRTAAISPRPVPAEAQAALFGRTVDGATWPLDPDDPLLFASEAERAEARYRLADWTAAELRRGGERTARDVEESAIYLYALRAYLEVPLDVPPPDAGNVQIPILRGLALLREGLQHATALELATAWRGWLERHRVDDAPALAEAHLQCGMALAALDRRAAAFESLGNAIERFTSAVESGQRPDLMLRLAETWRRRGELALTDGRASECVRDCTRSAEVVRARSGSLDRDGRVALAEAYRGLGEGLSAAGRIQEACRYLDAALNLYEPLEALSGADLHPATALIRIALGTALLEHDAAEAVEHFSAAQELLEPLPERAAPLARCHRGLASAHDRLGNRAAALRQEEQAIALLEQLLPRTDAVCLELSQAYAHAGQLRDEEEAAAGLDAFIKALALLDELNPEDLGIRAAQAPLLCDAASAYMLRGNDAEALAHFTQAVDKLHALLAEEPDAEWEVDLARALNNRGYVRTRLGDPQAALDDYGRAVDLYADLARRGKSRYREDLALARFNRGGAHRRSGHAVEALQDYDAAIELYDGLRRESDSPQRRWDHAAVLANRGLTHADRQTPDAALQDYRAALDLYESLAGGTEERPDLKAMSSQVLAQRGDVHLGIADWESALADFNRALDLLPPVPEVDADQEHERRAAELHRRRSLAYAGLGQLDLALNDCVQACNRLQQSIDRQDSAAARLVLAECWLQRGDLTDQLGTHELSIKCYDTGLKSLPPGPGAQRRRLLEKRAAMRLRSEQPDVALADLEAALEGMEPEAPSATLHFLRGLALLALQLPADALAAAEMVLEAAVDPVDHARGRLIRGSARLELGAAEEAETDLEQARERLDEIAAIRRQPGVWLDLADAHQRLAQLHELKQNAVRAATHYAWSIDLLREVTTMPRTLGVRVRLARTHRRRAALHLAAGRRDEGREDLRRAASLYSIEVSEKGLACQADLAHTLLQLAATHDFAEESDAVHDYWERAMEAARQAPPTSGSLMTQVWRDAAAMAERLGETAGAREARDYALEALRRSPNEHAPGDRDAALAMLHHERGEQSLEVGDLGSANADFELAQVHYERSASAGAGQLLHARVLQLGLQRGHVAACQGEAARALECYDNGLRELEAALAEDAIPPEVLRLVHHNRGVLLAREGRLEDAIEALDRSMRLSDARPAQRIATRLARACVLVDLGRSAEAVDELDPLGILAEPIHLGALAHYAGGRALLALKQPAAAVRRLAAATRSAARLGDALHARELRARARCYRGQGLADDGRVRRGLVEWVVAARELSALVRHDGQVHCRDLLQYCLNRIAELPCAEPVDAVSRFLEPAVSLPTA